MNSEENIVRGCVKGDRLAQKTLFETYAPTMLGICMRYSNDKEEAEDILHDSFIKVYTNIKNFRFEGSLEGWIRKIVVNTSLYHVQTKLKFSYHLKFEDINESEILNHHDLQDESASQENYSMDDLIRAIQKLPDGYRTVFNLYVFEKFKHKDIAEKLGINENTSKSQLHKARMMLQKILLNKTSVNNIVS